MKNILLVVLMLFFSFGAFPKGNISEQELLNIAASAGIKEKPAIFLRLARMFSETEQGKLIEFAEKAIFWGKKAENVDVQVAAYHLMGNSFQDQDEVGRAIDCYEDELLLTDQAKATESLADLYLLLARLYQSNGKERKAEQYYEKSLEAAKKNRIDSLVIQNYEALFRLNYERRRYRDAIEYFSCFLNVRDSLDRNKTAKRIDRITRNYETQVKKKNIAIDTLLQVRQEQGTRIDTLLQVRQEQGTKIEELAGVVQEKDLEIVKKDFEKKLLLIGIFAISLLMFLIYRLYSSKKEANILLSSRNAEIENQKEEIMSQRDDIYVKKRIIEEKNNQITDSILYATKIQKALLPSEEKMKRLFPQSFILNKPRDIVSGDFYWIESEKHNKVFLAVADCTGHGVPGGFLSMLGIEKLNKIISQYEKSELTPASILNGLNTEIQATLRQSGNQEVSPDGMDIAICEFDNDNKRVHFSGANRPLWVVKPDGCLHEYKPVKRGIGDMYNSHRPFCNQAVEVGRGDMLYLFSDGYEDQFGGSENHRIMKKNLKKLLKSIHTKDALYQREFLHAFFNAWKKQEFQTDDVLILGIRIQ